VSISRILLAGAGSQLAAFIAPAFADCHVHAFTRAMLDVTDEDAVSRTVATLHPDLIINCASFNNVDGAEDRPAEALAVNALGVRNLARGAESCGAVLVHYSTDFVINSSSEEPHREDVAPSPRGVYASSKLLGEWFAQQTPRSFVLRVESLFGSSPEWNGRRSTVDHIVDGLERGREVRVFTDRIVSPSYMLDVAAATRHLVLGAPPGLYHCVNAGHGSWYEVASHVAILLGVRPRLVPVTVEQMALRVPRPLFCALSPGKLAATGFRMPSWRDGLQRWLAGRGSGHAGKSTS
jgi:dTDP-4-dehydrorhamnose reductase